MGTVFGFVFMFTGSIAGWKLTFLFGDGLHNIRGTEALRDADLMFVSVRRQALPPEQFRYIKEYCEAGKPVVGIRTASHAFAERRGKPSPGGVLWPEFDGEILGGNYSGHHDSKSAGAPVTRVEVAKEALGHPILKGVPRDAYATSCSLYKVTPLSTNATVLMLGEIEGHEAQPVAWTNVGKYGNRVFYTSLGHPDDFEIESFRTLLRNGILWAVGETAETGLTAEEASSLN